MSFNIGWSEVNITPDKKVSLEGQFAERISEYVEKPLTATALAIESNGEQLVMVSCDLVHISEALTAAVRAELAGNDVGLDINKIVLSAIHTHTGPGYAPGDASARSFMDLRLMLNQFMQPNQKYVEAVSMDPNPEVATAGEVFDLLVERITKAILEAWANKAPGSFSNAFGRAVVGMCRRAAYNDGSAQMWGDTNTAVFEALEGGNDSGIELMYIFNADKKLTGIVANLACPAQCVQHRHFVSPDFWGEAKMLLRKYFGEDLFLLAQCSAAGDQCPVDLIRWVEPESDLNDPNCKRSNPPKRKADPSMFDLAGMRKTGKRIANEIIEVWEEGLDEPQTDPEFEHRVVHMQLPLRRATLTDVNNAKKAIKDYFRDVTRDVDYNDVANLQVHLGILTRFQEQEKTDVLDIESHIVRLGSIAIASNPFELFLDYGNQIKARSAAEQTFLVQLSSGGPGGYLPTKKAESGGHYSAFISSGHIGHVGGEQLVRETLQNIRQMFAE